MQIYMSIPSILSLGNYTLPQSICISKYIKTFAAKLLQAAGFLHQCMKNSNLHKNLDESLPARYCKTALTKLQAPQYHMTHSFYSRACKNGYKMRLYLSLFSHVADAH
jgi:hypothetical protein